MNAYYTYWNTPVSKISKDLLDLYKISIFFAKKHFSNVYLITDTESADFFKTFGLSKIYTDLDSASEYISLSTKRDELWSLGKIFSYKKIAEIGNPFIHLDHDVILWKKLPEKILTSSIFAQSIEDWAFKEYDVEKFLKKCPNTSIIDNTQLNAYNMGFFGGNDLKFIHEYAENAISLATDPQNYDFFKNEKLRRVFSKACIIEQYMLAAAAYKRKKNIETFSGDWNINADFWRKCDPSHTDYTHFMSAKNNPGFRSCIDHILNNYLN